MLMYRPVPSCLRISASGNVPAAMFRALGDSPLPAPLALRPYSAALRELTRRSPALPATIRARSLRG
ncbi:hypothetical protein D3C71_2186620 [compost metagenome]